MVSATLTMRYIEAQIIATEETAEILTVELQPFAEDQSVIQEQMGDPADLNPRALLPNIAIKFWFEEIKDSPSFRMAINQIAERYGCQPATFNLLDSTDWTVEWRKNYKPILAGERFIILPPWEENPEPTRIPILIDPGIAFGTGQHETTRLCIQQLEKHVEPGQRILDLGAGSAILSMAAVHLGASRVAAVETDADAVRSAAENLTLNQIDSKIELIRGSLSAVQNEKWDLVVANILAVILIQLIQEEGLLQSVKPGGRIIFSGIIDQQQAEFLQAIDLKTFEVEEITAEGEWIAVTVRRL